MQCGWGCNYNFVQSQKLQVDGKKSKVCGLHDVCVLRARSVARDRMDCGVSEHLNN